MLALSLGSSYGLLLRKFCAQASKVPADSVLSCITLANAVACCFLKPVKVRMTEHVESALEKSATRDSQFGRMVDAKI